MYAAIEVPLDRRQEIGTPVRRVSRMKDALQRREPTPSPEYAHGLGCANRPGAPGRTRTGTPGGMWPKLVEVNEAGHRVMSPRATSPRSKPGTPRASGSPRSRFQLRLDPLPAAGGSASPAPASPVASLAAPPVPAAPAWRPETSNAVMQAPRPSPRQQVAGASAYDRRLAGSRASVAAARPLPGPFLGPPPAGRHRRGRRHPRAHS